MKHNMKKTKNKSAKSKVYSEMGKRAQKKITLAERVRRAKKGWKTRRKGKK